MKTISIFLALINSLFAGFLIALDLSYHGFNQGSPWWSLLKLSTASLILAIGVAAWLGEMGLLRSAPILLGGLFLIALGPSTVVWTIHVALTAGDVKYYMAVYGMSLMTQGISSLFGVTEGSGNAVTLRTQ